MDNQQDEFLWPDDKPKAASKTSKVELAAAIGKAIANLAIISASIFTLLKKQK